MCPLAFAKSAISLSYLAFAAIRAAPIPSSNSRLYPTQVGHLGWWAEIFGHCGLEYCLYVAAHHHSPRRLERQSACDSMGFVRGIVFRLARPTVGELAFLLFNFGQRSAEETSAICFRDEEVIGSVENEGRRVVSRITSFAKRLPVGIFRVKAFVGIVRVVSTFVSQELTGQSVVDIGNTNAARFFGKVSRYVAFVLWDYVSESKAVIIDAEKDRHLPSSFQCGDRKCVAMVPVLAAFAYRKRVGVIHCSVLCFH